MNPKLKPLKPLLSGYTKAPNVQSKPILAQNKPHRKLTAKDKLFAEALIKHKGNQSRAYNEVYGEHNNNGTRRTKALMTKKDDILGTNHIDEGYIVSKLDKLSTSSRKDSDKIRATELLGKWLALFTDKLSTTVQDVTGKDEESILKGLRDIELRHN